MTVLKKYPAKPKEREKNPIPVCLCLIIIEKRLNDRMHLMRDRRYNILLWLVINERMRYFMTNMELEMITILGLP